MHGDLDQKLRMKILQAFRDGELKLLIASDVAARGLDIPNVSHIFNFDVPIHSEDYVHRIGRTGRAGRSGKSITLCLPSEEKYLAKIEELVKKAVPVMPSPLGGDEDRRPQPLRASRAASAASAAPARRPPRARPAAATDAGRPLPEPAEAAAAPSAPSGPSSRRASRAEPREPRRRGTSGSGHGRPRPGLPDARAPHRAGRGQSRHDARGRIRGIGDFTRGPGRARAAG